MAGPDKPTKTLHYEIDKELHQRAKVAAAQLGITIKAFVEQALDEKAKQVEKKNGPKKRR